jgi:hypothetical protein
MPKTQYELVRSPLTGLSTDRVELHRLMADTVFEHRVNRTRVYRVYSTGQVMSTLRSKMCKLRQVPLIPTALSAICIRERLVTRK